MKLIIGYAVAAFTLGLIADSLIAQAKQRKESEKDEV